MWAFRRWIAYILQYLFQSTDFSWEDTSLALWRYKDILKKWNVFSLSIAFGLSVLDKYQAASGDVAASSKWKGTRNLTYKETYLSCYYMKLLTAPTTKGRWCLFSQGISQHGNREGWIGFFVRWLFHWKKDELCFLRRRKLLVRSNLGSWWEPGDTGRLHHGSCCSLQCLPVCTCSWVGYRS